MDIPRCLVDTNILLRSALRSDPQHAVVNAALSRLNDRRTTLHFTHQNIAELWNVMTRPADRNGFGFTSEETETQIAALESELILLPEGEATYREWRRLVVRYRVSGVHVHDARLVATMHIHGVEHLLTLNTSDFVRFQDLITVIAPTDL
jgi:predicted nucleic acid-binding protein